jgi:hypothetical protein
VTRETADAVLDADGAQLEGSATHVRAGAGGQTLSVRALAIWQAVRWPVCIYGISRLLLLLLGVVDSALQHWGLASELSNWDGVWYLALAQHGYPTHVSHLQTTLGFFPLYPMVMWLVAHVLDAPMVAAGLVVSGLGGLCATILLEKLATRWWDADVARRAVVLFCAFPGSVVFSMVYSEGVLLPLAMGCLLALASKRWLLAGILAGLATAVGPDSVAIVLACAVAAFVEIRRLGFHDRAARRSLVAPVLSPVGIGAVGAFFWAWTGTPLANFDAQRYGWGERTTPFALWREVKTLSQEISLRHFDYHLVNLNYVVGLAGAVLLVYALVLLARQRHAVAPEALAWTLGIAFLSLTSQYTPPNPRLLITAFPVVAVLAYRVRNRRFTWLVAANVVLLVVLSAITYVGIALRP